MKYISNRYLQLVFLGLAVGIFIVYKASDPSVSAWTEYDIPTQVQTVSGYWSNGEFSAPHSIDQDINGNLYVTDFWLKSLSKFDANGNFLWKIGSFGTGEGQFNWPTGVVSDSTGNVYVSDENRIQKFDTNGNYLSTFGTSGSGDGQFNVPLGLSIDAGGNIYVADSGNNRIQKFNSSGVYLSQFGSTGSGDGAFSNPVGVAVDSIGNIWVSDTYNDRIQKFNSSGVYILKVGTWGSGDGQFKYTNGLEVDTSGNVYVTDMFNNRVQKFSNLGVFQSKFGTYGIGDGNFFRTNDIKILSNGDMWVVDYWNGRIQKFNSSGIFLTKFGSNKIANGKFSSPKGITVDSSGNVYVADAENNRVQKFNSQGNYVMKLGTETWGSLDGQFDWPYSVAVESSGNILVVDRNNNRIQKFDQNGTFLDKFGTLGSGNGQLDWPNDIVIDSIGNYYVSENENDRIQKFDSDGNYLSKFGANGTNPGQFNSPSGMVIDSDGNLIIADYNNNRIQKVSPTGTPLLSFGSYGSGNGQFNHPSDVALDSIGNIYVVENSNNRVQKFDSSGNFLTKFGTYGFSETSLYLTYNLAIDSNDNIFVVANDSYKKFVLDKVTPILSYTHLTNDITNTESTVINGNTSDTLSAITQVSYQMDGTSGTWVNCSAIDGSFNSNSESYNCNVTGITEGLRNLYIRSTDSFTNSIITQYPFTADLSPSGSGSIVINGGSTQTNLSQVSLTISSTDTISNVSHMMISNNPDFSTATWENYTTSKVWNLTSGDGTKTIYIKFKDLAGNQSEVYSNSIILDTTPPAKPRITNIGTISNVADKDILSYTFTSETPRIKGIAEANSKIYFVLGDTIYQGLTGTDGKFNILIINPELERTTNTIKYYVVDEAGNQSAERTLILIIGSENFPTSEESSESSSESSESEVSVLGEFTIRLKAVDPLGNPVEGVRIELDNGKISYTGKDGYAYFKDLPEGTYNTKFFYSTYTQESVISVNDTSSYVDVIIQVAKVPTYLSSNTTSTNSSQNVNLDINSTYLSIGLIVCGSLGVLIIMILIISLFVKRRKKEEKVVVENNNINNPEKAPTI